MDPAGVVDAGRPEGRARWGVKRLEDVEDLEGDDAGAIRPMRRDPHAAIRRLDRLGPRRLVRPEIDVTDRAADGRQPASLAFGDRALVEVVEARVGEPLERRAEGRQSDPLAWTPRPALRPVHLLEARTIPERFHDGG